MYGNNSKTSDWKGKNRESKNSIQQIDCEKSHPRIPTYCHPRKSTNRHLRMFLSGIQVPCHPQLDWGSSPFFYLFEEEILPGFRIKCGMTTLMSFRAIAGIQTIFCFY